MRRGWLHRQHYRRAVLAHQSRPEYGQLDAGMKKLTSIGIVALVVATSSFLITRPTYANTGPKPPVASEPIGTHKVWHPNYTSIFKLRQFGTLCMPGTPLTSLSVGDVVVGTETKTCEGISFRFRRVSHNYYMGWMWDFALEVIDPLEGHFPPTNDNDESPVPVLVRDEELPDTVIVVEETS